MKVLIVDDDVDICMILELIFKKKGWEASYVTSGKKALQWLEGNTVDVVFLDLLMPEMGGDEMLREMQKNRKMAEIPVIFLTAKEVTQKEKAELIGMGAKGVYPKPVDPLFVMESALKFVKK